MPRTKEDLLAELEEDKARVRSLQAEHGVEFIDPDSDDGVEWAERNARIDENTKTLEQAEEEVKYV